MPCIPRSRPGFTLIELLIVVAIIAILAAIAVPNFLEAQTRSKVSRAKADMRSVATAIEAYAVDNNTYPPAVVIDDPAEFVFASTAEVFEGAVPRLITTPIAYMTSLPEDPFPVRGQAEHREGEPFHYLDRGTAVRRGEPEVIADFHEVLLGARQSVGWWMFSLGPDLDHDESLDGSDPKLATALYDPTNGTVSSGDIYMFQGKGLGR